MVLQVSSIVLMALVRSGFALRGPPMSCITERIIGWRGPAMMAGEPVRRADCREILAHARAWGARPQATRHQTGGPITRAFLEVLEAPLWGFHNSRDGR
jgi:hypothetical protein